MSNTSMEPQATTLYEGLRELAVHDSTVYSFLKAAHMSRTPELETAIAIIKQLAREKQAYLDDAIQTRNMSIVPVQPMKGV